MDRVDEGTEPGSAVGEAQEWLSHEDAAAENLLASVHLHRYELAAELAEGLRVLDLCCGTGYGSEILAGRATAVRGVDIDEEAIVTARRETMRSRSNVPVDFAQVDALAELNGLGPETWDVVVCFEGIEHLPDPVAVADALARLARQGTRLIVSLPNSRGFDEENPYHVTEFGYEEAMELFARLGEPLVLMQYLTEGSLILPADQRRKELSGRLVGDAEPAPEWANNWVATVNVPSEELQQVLARLRVATSAHHNEYMRSLEGANRQLALTNRRLQRRRLGVHDAAAATLTRRATEAEARVEQLKEQLALEVEIAKQNDRLFQDARRALQSPRYRAVDRVRDVVLTIPVVGRLVRAAWRRMNPG